MDTPNISRGELYNTTYRHKCSAYKQCIVCKMCESFSADKIWCLLCEDRKVPFRTCKCKVKTKENMALIESKIGPLIDINARPGTKKLNTDVAYDKNWDKISGSLASKYGHISEVE